MRVVSFAQTHEIPCEDKKAEGKHGIRVAHHKEPASKALVRIMGHGFLAVLVDFSFI